MFNKVLNTPLLLELTHSKWMCYLILTKYQCYYLFKWASMRLFMPLFSFYIPPWKHQITRVFSDVFRGYRQASCCSVVAQGKYLVLIFFNHLEILRFSMPDNTNSPTARVRKTNICYPLIRTRTYICVSGVRNVRFSEILLGFLETSVLRFSLL